jgi:tetratricopeptide (TPR) repeat protein
VRVIGVSPQGKILVSVTQLVVSLLLAWSALAQTSRLGRIDFPTSAPPSAQQRFIQGVLLLHSFQYGEARQQFQAALNSAPKFAMAYWGEAMTYNEPLWFAQDAPAARAVLKRAPQAATARERAYLNAVAVLYGSGKKEDRDFAYAAAMGRLHEAYPEDHEAAAFYALSLLGTAHAGRNFRIYMQAAAIAEDILARNPEHPGALHYAIHCYDDPVHAPLGLRAARVYAKIAPASAHALHMPSHIFFAMGLWDDAASSNEASFRSAHPAEAARWHALWWLGYAHLQQGRYADARRLLQIPAVGSLIARFHVVQMRAMYSIETGEPYTAGADTAGLDLPAAAADLFAAGWSALNQGRRETAELSLKGLQALRPTGASAAHAGHTYAGDEQAARIMENELAAMLLMADGKSREAIDLMKTAIALEDRMPYEFGPPIPPKPAHELLGEMLLSLNQPQLARVQFELALQRAPQRALSLLGLARALEQGGSREEATNAWADLGRIWTKADPAIKKALHATRTNP